MRCGCASIPITMSTPLDLANWHPASWRSRPAQQQATYNDAVALDNAVAELARLPPIVVSWEIEALKQQIASAQRGERFVLQGGDCAEVFSECDSDLIAKKLKILLQMSLVLVHGLKKPVVRIGRMAGQYAKPRSADTETKDGITLPSYRGDIVNDIAFNWKCKFNFRFRRCGSPEDHLRHQHSFSPPKFPLFHNNNNTLFHRETFTLGATFW